MSENRTTLKRESRSKRRSAWFRIASTLLASLAFVVAALPTPAFAWVNASGTIVEMRSWQDDNITYFRVSDGTKCYIQPHEERLFVLLTTLYLEERSADFVCHDEPESAWGINALHRLHRVTLP